MLFKKKKYDTNTMKLSDIMRYMSFIAHSHDFKTLLYYCKKQSTDDLVILKKFIEDDEIDFSSMWR